MVCCCLVVVSCVPKTYFLKTTESRSLERALAPLLLLKQRCLREATRETEMGVLFSFFLVHKYALQSFFFVFFGFSRSRGSSLLAHERIAAVDALLLRGGLVLGRDDDGVLVHQLAGGVGESRQGQGDPLHLALIHPLLVLLLQVSTPEHKDETVSEVSHR